MIRSKNTEAGKFLSNMGFRCYGPSSSNDAFEEWGKGGVMIEHWQFDVRGCPYESFTLVARFETKFEVWADFKFYSLDLPTLREKLHVLMAELESIRSVIENENRYGSKAPTGEVK